MYKEYIFPIKINIGRSKYSHNFHCQFKTKLIFSSLFILLYCTM